MFSNVKNIILNRSSRYFLISVMVAFLGLSVNVSGQKYLNKGNKYFNRNLFEEAIPYYVKDMNARSYKIRIEAMEKLANCYRLTGRFWEAEEMYRKILEMSRDKNKAEHYLNYGKSLKSSAKYEEAAVQFAKYIELMPSDPMGDIYFESCFLAQQWLDEEEKYIVRNYEMINNGWIYIIRT